jgi:hypothetical protein
VIHLELRVRRPISTQLMQVQVTPTLCRRKAAARRDGHIPGKTFVGSLFGPPERKLVH